MLISMCTRSAHCTLSKGHDGRCVEPPDPYTQVQMDLEAAREQLAHYIIHGLE